MKRIIYICFFLLGFLQVNAQDRDSHRERIKSHKTAYITERLNLSSEEAQKFWPIYNEFEEKKRSLYRKEHAEIENIECISEERASKMLTEYVDIEQQDYLLQRKFFQDLKQIFPATKIIQLKKVEDDFNKKLLREYRERKAKEENNS